MPRIGYFDTNIGIMRLTDGDGFLDPYDLENRCISSYVVGEFDRTMVLDCCSLLTMIMEEVRLSDVYRRSNNMQRDGDHQHQRVAHRYDRLLDMMDFPAEKDREWAIQQLRLYLRFRLLIRQFVNEVEVLKSKTGCIIPYCRPTSRGGSYYLQLECLSEDGANICMIFPFFHAQEEKIIGLLDRVVEEHDGNPYLARLNATVQRLFSSPDLPVQLSDCMILGDLIVALECLLHSIVLTADDDVRLICDAMGQPYFLIPPR